MGGVRRGVILVTLMVGLLCGGRAIGQVAMTAIQDTVYRADGTAASGSIVVSWPTFTTAAGQVVASGSTSAVIGPVGAVSLNLAPNAGAIPVGTYYTAVLHLDDGTTSRQYWVVPVSASPVKISAIENQVLPTSVAMQTASRAYVDAAVARVATTSGGGTTGSYVQKGGDAMAGPLILPGDPVTPYQAADKNYVDTNITATIAGIIQKASLLPTATQTLTQPAGTQFQVNALNGQLFASQFQTGDGKNGIANTLGSAQCASGCDVVIDASYPMNEGLNAAQVAQASHVTDRRQGADVETFVEPGNRQNSYSVAQTVNQISLGTDANAPWIAVNSTGTSHFTQRLTNSAVAGGANQLPGNIENMPYGKATYGVQTQTGDYYTQGQHVQNSWDINCYGVGDCLAGGRFLTSSGGYRDMADEGAHPFDLQVTEDWGVFHGTCIGGCTTGSTSVQVDSTGTQGEGRFLIDKNPAKVIATGAIVSPYWGTFHGANFSGTNFPVSVFLQVTAAATSQPKALAPGTVTLPVATSNVPAGFATSTSALPATTGVACVADSNDLRFPNFETANYTVVDASHITLTLNKVHGAGAAVVVGGLCGYGLEQTVDTVNGIRQLFPVIGSISPTTLYYGGALTPIVGNPDAASTSGYLNVSLQAASISRANNVVTVKTASNMPVDLNGLTLTVSGVADASYNGSFKVTTTGNNTLTYASTGADGTSSGGTIGILTGGFALYPMAEVLSVYNPATKKVDGLLTLAPNAVAWAQGDAVEEPHYYQQSTFADTEFVTQWTPRPIQYASAGKQYQGNVGPGVRGWVVANAVPANNYVGGGGTHELPDNAYMANGPWKNDFVMDAGTQAVLRVHCNLNGCNRWDSAYALFSLDSAHGVDLLFYDPNSDTASWMLGGQTYSFAPSGFSANTINSTTINTSTVSTGTLNATTINGALQASGGTSKFVGPNSQYGRALHLTPYAAGYQTGIDFDNPTGVTETQVCGGSSYPGQTNRWQFTMAGDYSWVLYDTTGCRSVLQVMPGGTMALMPSGSGNLTVGGSVTGTLPGMFNVGTANQFFVDGSGNVSAAGTVTAKTAIASGTAANTDLVGTLVLAAGSTASASYAFTGHYASAPVCMVQPQSATPAVVQGLGAYVAQVSATALSVNAGAAPGSAVTFGYTCVARN